MGAKESIFTTAGVRWTAGRGVRLRGPPGQSRARADSPERRSCAPIMTALRRAPRRRWRAASPAAPQEPSRDAPADRRSQQVRVMATVGGSGVRALPASKTDGGGLTDCPPQSGPCPPTRRPAHRRDRRCRRARLPTHLAVPSPPPAGRRGSREQQPPRPVPSSGTMTDGSGTWREKTETTALPLAKFRRQNRKGRENRQQGTFAVQLSSFRLRRRKNHAADTTTGDGEDRRP